MALEQTINKSQKSSSGIIGNTRKKHFVAMWNLIYHEILAISNLHRELSGINKDQYKMVINAFNRSETQMSERNVQAILNVIEAHENPFKQNSDQAQLHNILTQEVMTEEIRNHILRAIEIGTDAYKNY